MHDHSPAVSAHALAGAVPSRTHKPAGTKPSPLVSVLMLAILGLVVAGVFFVPRWIGPRATGVAAATGEKEEKPSFDPKTTVVLADGKRKVAGIALGEVRKDELATEVTVAGTVSLNRDRQVEIKPRVPGVVRSVAVMIGRKVKAGDVLATLDSAEVGAARLNLRARQRELATTKVEAEWKREVNKNVAELVPLLRKSTPMRKLEDMFRDKPLGAYRGDLLGTYAEFEIASHEEEKQADMFKNNLVGEHPVFVSKHTREGKQARFESSLEQVRFDASLQSRLADQQVRAAEASVIDAAQRLRILGVSEDLSKVFDPPPPIKTADGQFEDVTIYSIVAPFDGTIVSRTAVPSQRVELTDSLFNLADLTTVRVTANVPESLLGLLPALGKPTLQVTATAYPGKQFPASVIYVSEEVDPATRTVGLIAEMPNPDGQLRPGMFVQIKLDSPVKTTAFTLPSGAIVEIEGKTGVFCIGKDPNTFVFHYVQAKAEANGRRAIISGLKEGEQVVVTGAFTLKSELVLQNETEED